MITNNWVIQLSGTDASGTVNLVTSALATGGPFTITAITGTWNGNQIVGLLPTNSYQNNDNTLKNNISSPFSFDNDGFSFQTSSAGIDKYVNVFSGSNLHCYVDQSSNLNGAPKLSNVTQLSSTSDTADTWSYDISSMGIKGIFTIMTTLANSTDSVRVTNISGTWGGRPIVDPATGSLTLSAPYGPDGNLGGGIDGFQNTGISFSTTDVDGNYEQVTIRRTLYTIEVDITTQQIVGYTKAQQPIYYSASGPATVNSFLTTACFLEGTGIATPAGRKQIEDLKAGDLVTLACSGTASVVWVGSYQVDCNGHPTPELIRPVRVRADAFGIGVPDRDLFLSPEHALYLEGVLIPVSALIDGETIRQSPAGVVRYFHVELTRHDVILAENLPVESYLDSDDHAAFDNGAEAPDSDMFQAPCAALVRQGPQVQRAREALLSYRLGCGQAA